MLSLLSPILFWPTLSYLSICFGILSYNILEVMIVKPLKKKISITIDSDILAILKEDADFDDRSLSQYINIILKQYIRNKENKPSN